MNRKRALIVWFCVAVAMQCGVHAAEASATAVGEQWRAQAVDGALAAAAEIEDPYRRAERYARIARVQAALGQAKPADASIERALATAQRISTPAFQDWALAEIASAQLAAHDEYGARQTIARIAAAQPQAAALTQLSGLALRREDVQAALSAAMEIRDMRGRSDALREIVAFHAQRGDVDAARALLRHIRDAGAQALARGDIALAELRRGELEHAYELAARAPRRQRAQVYGRIAQQQLAAGHVAASLTTLEKIRDPLVRSAVLGQAAAVRRNSGDVQGADALAADSLRAAQEVRSVRERLALQVALARLYWASGEAEAARRQLGRLLTTALAELEGQARDETVGSVARAYSQFGDREQALASAAHIQDRIERALLVRDLAASLPGISLQSARALAAPFDDSLLEAAVLFGVLGERTRRSERADLELLHAAAGAVRALDDVALKPAAFAALAVAQLQFADASDAAELFSDALASSAALPHPEQRADAYLRIVESVDERVLFLGRPVREQREDDGA